MLVLESDSLSCVHPWTKRGLAVDIHDSELVEMISWEVSNQPWAYDMPMMEVSLWSIPILVSCTPLMEDAWLTGLVVDTNCLEVHML